MFKTTDELRVGVIGLGYVGLPLAVDFAKKRFVISFDIGVKRLQELQRAFPTGRICKIGNGTCPDTGG